MPRQQDGRTVPSYSTGWVANGLSWSTRENAAFRFAVSSYTQDYRNYVDIVQKNEDEQLVCRATWEHCYPPTKVMFAPQKATKDFIITTADYLRLWEVKEGPPSERHQQPQAERPPPRDDASASESDILARKRRTIDSHVVQRTLYKSGKPNDFCSPITSCDWNDDDPTLVGCCSIDTTVTIWNLETGKTNTQLIAHDKDVYDIAFAKGTQTFASCGADGSVRIFDLRDMEHCTIAYESPQLTPLLRVAWNQMDQTYLSTFGVEDSEVIVIDIRFPGVPAGTLKNVHTRPINCIGWAPNSVTNLCSAGEDGMAIIWDLNELPNVAPQSIMDYKDDQPINNISWSSQHEQWIAITVGSQARLLHI